MTPIGLARPAQEFSDLNFVAGTAGQEVRMRTAGADSVVARAAAAPAGRGGGGGGGGYGGVSAQGLPLSKPPYATISAINLDRGDIVRQVAHGEMPDATAIIRRSRACRFCATGQSGYNIGTLVTKSLVIAATA